MKGAAFITFTCTPHYKKHHDGHSDGGHAWKSAASVDSLESAASNYEGDLAADSDYTSDSPETFSIEAVLDAPPDDQADQSCDSTTTASAAVEITPGEAGQDACDPSGQSEIDCTADSAGSPDPARCPPADQSADVTIGSSSTEAQESTSSSTSDPDATGMPEGGPSVTTDSEPADLPSADLSLHSK
jgi:hypothetical protein